MTKVGCMSKREKGGIRVKIADVPITGTIIVAAFIAAVHMTEPIYLIAPRGNT